MRRMNPAEKRRRQAEMTMAAAPENRTSGPAKDTATTDPKRARPGGRKGWIWSGSSWESRLMGDESTENSYEVPAGAGPAEALEGVG